MLLGDPIEPEFALGQLSARGSHPAAHGSIVEENGDLFREIARVTGTDEEARF